jgi:hypothetical protein
LPKGDCGWKRIALFLGGVCVTRVPLGDTSHLFLGDVASEKSGPAEGVGVWGRSPHVETMSTTVFNIDMHVDIHLNIDC